MELNLEITSKQLKFIESDCYETLYGGAAGGGKSYGQLIDSLLYALEYSGSRQLVLRRTFPELNRSLILVSFTLYPKDICRYNSSEHKYYFHNGSIIEFGYLDRDSSVAQYQSAEYDVIRFDELTHFTEFQYTYMQSRIRGANDFPKKIKSSTNPGSEGHAWVKARFIDNKIPEKVYTDEDGNTTVFIPAKVQENTFLMQKDPKYLQRLGKLDEDTKRALLHGEWDIFAGQVFKEFRKELHVVKPFDIPKNWKRFRSLDWGYNDPLCCLWYAVDPDNHIYVYRELYINETPASKAASYIRELDGSESILYMAASPDMWAKRGNDSIHGESIADTFIKFGCTPSKADNDRINGWQRIHEFLKLAPDGQPYLMIFETCVNLIRTLPALVYNDKAGSPEDVSDKCEDHAPESLRYGVMSRPRPFDPPKLQVPADLPEDIRQDLENDEEALKHWLQTHKG